MNNLFHFLIENFVSKGLDKYQLLEIFGELGMKLPEKITLKILDDELINKEFTKLNMSAFLLLLILFNTDKKKKRILLKRLRIILNEIKDSSRNKLQEFHLFICNLFNDVVNFLVENFYQDLYEFISCQVEDHSNSENCHGSLEKYLFLIQSLVNDIFEMLISFIGNKRSLLEFKQTISLLMQGFIKLDHKLKRILLIVFGINKYALPSIRFEVGETETEFDNTLTLEFNQNLILIIFSSLVKIASTTINFCDDIKQLQNYTFTLHNSEVKLDQIDEMKVLNEVINYFSLRLLRRNYCELDRDLITSIGTYLSYYFLTDLYLRFEYIEKKGNFEMNTDFLNLNINKFLKINDFSNTGMMSFYRGSLVFYSMLNNIRKKSNFEIVDFGILNSSFLCFNKFLNNSVDEDSSYAIQSLAVWISIFKNELSLCEKEYIQIKLPLLSFLPLISKSIFSALDQPMNYHSKLATHALQEFIELLLTLDAILMGLKINELNSDIINWFINFILNYSWNNYKNKFFCLQLVFNGILRHNNIQIFRYLNFGKLNSLKDFEFVNISKIKKFYFKSYCKEVQFLFLVIYSLSINDLSSSAFNLIYTWFSLIEKLCLSINSLNRNYKKNLLEFLLFSSIKIVKYELGIYDKIKISISQEGKINILNKTFQLLSKIDRDYYNKKLPTLFHFFVISEKNALNVSNKPNSLNFIQANILFELKKNGFLHWTANVQNENDCKPVLPDLAVSFDNLDVNYIFNSTCIIESIISQKQYVSTTILNVIFINSNILIKEDDYEPNKELLNQIQYLSFILFNLKPISGQISTLLVNLFKEKFILVNKLFANISLELKEQFKTCFKKLFVYLLDFLGLYTSSDKISLILPIFCHFVDIFCSEDNSEEMFGFEFLTSNNFLSIIISKIQSMLFSSSTDSKELILNLLSKFKYKLFTKFCNSIFNEDLCEFKFTLNILKNQFTSLRPREYRPSCIMIYIYFQLIVIQEDKLRRRLLDLFFGIFNFDNSIMTINSNHDILLLIIFLNNQLVSRITNYSLSDKKFFVSIQDKNLNSLESTIYLLGICIRFEFEETFTKKENITDKTHSKNFFKEVLLESTFLLLFTLFITLKDEKFLFENSAELSVQEFEYECYSESEQIDRIIIHRVSKIIEEICFFLKIIFTKVNIFAQAKFIKNKIIFIIDSLINKDDFSCFFQVIKFSILSGNDSFFFNTICIILIQFILTSNHSGNSDNLIELFSIFSNSFINFNLNNSSINTLNSRKKCYDYKVRINVPISNQLGSIFKKFEILDTDLFRICSIFQKKSKSFKNNNSSELFVYEFPMVWLLHIIYSIISNECQNFFSDDNYCYNNLKVLNYEKIEFLFQRIFELNKKECRFIKGNSIILNLNEILPLSKKVSLFPKRFQIPSPKRNSHNLSNLISTIMCIIIKYFKGTRFLKSIIKLLIIASFHNKYLIDQKSENINLKESLKSNYEYNVHCNHIIANLILKSGIGSGSNTLFELFDVNLLSGALISAFNNIQIYKYENNDGFLLCNSSLNLMSALIKKFSSEKTINDFFSQNKDEIQRFSLTKENFSFISSSKSSIDIYKFFYQNEKIISGLIQINHLYFHSLYLNLQNTYSFNLIKKDSTILENCITEALYKSNFPQFQGMILLFLSGISISWSDCTLDIALPIIKSIYSPNYYIRIHSANLISSIIIETLNNSKKTEDLRIEVNDNIEKKLYSIFVLNSSNRISSQFSLLRLFYDSIKYSLSCNLEKYNLFHGLISLGIRIMRTHNVKIFLSLIISENIQNKFFYQELLRLLSNELDRNLLENYLLRISILEFVKLLLEIKMPYEKNENSEIFISRILNHCSNESLFFNFVYINPIENHLNLFKEVTRKNIFESIIRLNIFLDYLIKRRNYSRLNDAIKYSFTELIKVQSTTIVHPQVLSQFYFSLKQHQIKIPKKDLYVFTSSISKILLNHLEIMSEIKNCFANSYKNSFCEQDSVFIKELFFIIVDYLSYSAIDENISGIFLLNQCFDSVIYLVFDIIEYFTNLNNFEIHKSSLELSQLSIKNAINSTNANKNIFRNAKLIHIFSIIFIRYYKKFFHLSNKYILNIKSFEKKVFEDCLEIFHGNINSSYHITTLEDRGNICNLIKITFKSILFELNTKGKIFEKNAFEIKENFINIAKDKSTIIHLFSSNHQYWFNLMILFIYILSDEVFEIRSQALEIFNDYYFVISFFCRTLIINKFNFVELDLNFLISSVNCIEYLIELNDGCSCLFSIKLLKSLTDIFDQKSTRSNFKSFFPKELDNICNEYFFIIQKSFFQIDKYIDFVEIEGNHEDFETVSNYFDCLNGLKEEALFRYINERISYCPDELISFEIFGNILNSDVDILFFTISFKKLVLMSKFYSKFSKKNYEKIENMLIFKDKIEHLIFNI